MAVRLGYQVLVKPPDEAQFDVEEQNIGKFYSRTKTPLVKENLGYYLVQLYLKADDPAELKEIDGVVYHLPSSLNPDIPIKNPENQFGLVATVRSSILNVRCTIYWKVNVNRAPSEIGDTFNLKTLKLPESKDRESGRS